MVISQNFTLFSRYVPRLVLSRPPGVQSFAIDGTLVFADVSGFTKLSERLAEQGKAGAEELTQILNDTFTDLLTVAVDEGGDLLKYGGDALLLLFAGDGHPARAARAAARMRTALRLRGPIRTGRGSVTLRISQGVHSGTFHCFCVGSHQQELVLAGHDATVVTDMETAADAGEVLLSQATAEALDPRLLGAPKGGGRLLRRMPLPLAVPAVAEPPERDDVERLVPTPVRRRLRSGMDEAEHRRVTVGFLHVFGLDDLVATLPPEEVLARLDHLVRVSEQAAADHGVCLISTDIAGDGTKLIFTAGAPDAVENSEGQMLAVCRAVLDQVDDLGLHAGVNAGHVFAGDVGAPFRRVYTVIGDAVNLAARLMAKAGPGQLLAQREVLERSATVYEATPLEPFLVKGKAKPIDASVVGARLGLRTHRPGAAAPFVGRESELAVLQEAVDRARAGHGSVVRVLGEAGLGKSRLVDHFLEGVPDARVFRLTCEPFLAERPYFMSRLVLRSLLDIDFGADPVTAGHQLERVVAERVPEVASFLPLLAIAVDAEVPSNPTVDEIAPANRTRVLREVADVVLRAVANELTVIVVEDADWMDEASAGLFARSLVQVGGRPWLFCLTTRGDERGLHPGLGFEAREIALAPLDPATVAALAAAAVTDAPVPAHDLEVLCGRSGGNPLYLLELVHARVDASSLDELPTTLEDIVGSRIDRLDPTDRRTLRYAAVLGDRFAPSLFTLAFGDLVAGADTHDTWDRLSEFLVEERGGDRSFAHDLVREVAYESLPYLRRRELHERVGLALERRARRRGDAASVLSLHFDRARDHARAWRYAREASDVALARYANVEAATFLERAYEHGRALDDVPPEQLAEIAERLGDVCEVVGRYDRATWGYRTARRLRGEHDHTTPRVLRKEGVIRERSGRYRAALDWYRRAMERLDDLPPDVRGHEAAELAVAYGGVRYRQGQLQDCVRWCRLALDEARRSGNRRAEAHACYLLDGALTDLGDPEAETYRMLALPIFEELGDLPGQSNVLSNLGIDALYEGDWQRAAELWERSRELRQRAGDVVGIANVGYNLGEVRTDQGRFDEAEHLLREARRIWRAAGYPLGVAVSTNGLGHLAARRGRTDEGVALLEESLESLRQLQATSWTWEVLVRIGEALAYGGRHRDALTHVEETMAVTDLTKQPNLHAMALRSRAVALHGLGFADEARTVLHEAASYAAATNTPYEEALCHVELARRFGEGDVDRARVLADRLGVDLAAAVPADLPDDPVIRTEH